MPDSWANMWFQTWHLLFPIAGCGGDAEASLPSTFQRAWP